MNAENDANLPEPTHVTPTPNSPIFISEENIELSLSDGNKVTARAKVSIALQPDMRLIVSVEHLHKLAGATNIDEKATVRFLDRNLSIDPLWLVRGPSSSFFIPKEGPIRAKKPQTAEIQRAIFHVLDFADFFSKDSATVNVGRKQYRKDYVVITFAQWKIILAIIPEHRTNYSDLRMTGGHTLTLVGQIERIDDQYFSAEEAQEILMAFYYFLSFSEGRWTPIILPIGWNRHKELVWEEWPSLSSDPFESTSSWFDRNHANLIADVFPGFLRMWEDSVWNKPLREALYWFMNANKSSRGIDTGIILAQAALDLISYTYVVSDKGLLTKKTYSNLPAYDKLSILLRSLGIPCEIPSRLGILTAQAKEFNQDTGPQIFTLIRNELVHPEHKSRGKLSDTYYEAWKLGLWYIDLVLLRLCDHSGMYANRLQQKRVGEVEEVPWAKEE